jgi:hypothetical protein
MLKNKRTYSKILLAVSGAVYLTTFSNLDINIFLKGYVAIIPIQIVAFAYAIYLVFLRKQ